MDSLSRTETPLLLVICILIEHDRYIYVLVAFTGNVMDHPTCQVGIVLIYASLAWQII